MEWAAGKSDCPPLLGWPSGFHPLQPAQSERNNLYDECDSRETVAVGGAFEEQKDSPYTALGVVEALTSPLPPELFINYNAEDGMIRVVGESLRRYEIESSLDLVNWSRLADEKSDSRGEVQFNIDVMRFKSQYFRATMTDQ